MSIWDDINPVNLAKKGLHKAEELESDALHFVEKPFQATASFVQNIDPEKIGTAFEAVGTALIHPVDTISKLISAAEAKTIVKNVTLVAELLNPATCGIALTQVAANKWMSKDNKYSYEKVDSLDPKDESDLAKYWAEYDRETGKNKGTTDSAPKTEPSHVDFNSRDIYPAAKGKEKVERSADTQEAKPQSRSYINADGQHAEVTVQPGQVDFTATKDGKVITQAQQANGVSTVSHEGETAVLDTRYGKLTLTSEQVKLLQDSQQARVLLASGLQIVRQGRQIELLDKNGQVLQALTQSGLQVAGDVQMFSSTAEMIKANETAGATAAGALGEQFHPGSEVSVQVATDGTALATLGNGTKIEMRNDGTALIKTSDGHVLLVSKGHTYFWNNGKFTDVDNDRNASGMMVDGDGVQAGGVHVNRHGSIEFAEGMIDLRNLVLRYRNGITHELHTVKLNKNAQGVKVETATTETTGKGNKVVTTTNSGETVTTDLNARTMGTKAVTVGASEVRIHHPHRADTIVKANNEVDFEGGRGPILYADGGMRLDDQTYVDARGHVTSGNWSASADTSEDAAGGHGQSICGASAELATSVQATAANANNVAMDVYAKAASGTVTLSDLNTLNQSVADVCSLMSALAAAGNMDLAGQLQSSLSMLSDAISFATPKAQAAQIAMDHGQSSPFLIKAIEDGTYGRSPDQAVLAVLAPAA